MSNGRGKRKGGAFENKMCRKISLWWSEGERDDLFTRTASSGGQYTQRKKNNLDTANQEGDITATTEEGLVLIQHCTFEMKTGYKNWSIMDIIDKPSRKGKSAVQVFEDFYAQVAETDKFPILITKKDRRQELIFFTDFFFYICSECAFGKTPPELLMYLPEKTSIVQDDIICMNLKKFFKWVSPYLLSDYLENLDQYMYDDYKPIGL